MSVLIAIELALFEKFFRKVNWPTRLKGLLVGFCVPLIFVVFMFTNEVGPGSGIVLLFPLMGAIVGYVLGFIIGLIKK